MGGPRGDLGPVSQQGQPAPQRLSPPVPGVTCLLSHVSGVDDTLTGAPALSQEPPGPRGLSDQQDSPSLPYCALERVPTSYLSPHSPCSRWGRHTCTPQGGRCGRCPGSGTGWTSRDHTWPGQPGWGDLRQGGILAQWGGRGTGLGRTPRPHPGILACRDAWREALSPRFLPLPVFPLDHFHIHLSSLRTLLRKNRVKNSPCLMGLEGLNEIIPKKCFAGGCWIVRSSHVAGKAGASV